MPYNKRAMSERLSLRSEQATDHSDEPLVSLLKRLKAAADPDAIRQLSEDIVRVIFHKQLENAQTSGSLRRPEFSIIYWSDIAIAASALQDARLWTGPV